MNKVPFVHPRFFMMLSARSAWCALCISALLSGVVGVRPLGVDADGASTSATSGTDPLVNDPCGTKGQNTNGTVLPGCGGWQAIASTSTRNIRMVDDLGHQVGHGLAEMDVTNFEPCWNFCQAPNSGDPCDEKYHWFAGSNHPRLDHHGDIAGDAGWTLHAIQNPGARWGRDCRDLKLLTYFISKDGAGKPEWYEENFNWDQNLEHVEWRRGATYHISVEWKPYKTYTRVILKRNGVRIITTDADGSAPSPQYDEDDPSQPNYDLVGDPSTGCYTPVPPDKPGCLTSYQNGKSPFQFTVRYIAIGSDRTEWWDADPPARCAIVHPALVGPIYKNIKIWEY